MDLKNYLDPVDISIFIPKNEFVLGKKVLFYSGDLDAQKASFGIVGVADARATNNEGTESSPDKIRAQLYPLYSRPNFPEFIDFGNVKNGFTPEDTEAAFSIVINELLENNIIPIIIGSKQYIYQAYKELNKRLRLFNITAIEPSLSLEFNESEEKSYLERIISEKSNSLLKFTNLGYQSYLVSSKETELYKRLGYEALRLGYVRHNLVELEPVIRDSDLTFMDIGVVKQADAPGNKYANPNGLYSEEICQLSRFVGMSNKLTMFGVFEVNPKFDHNKQTSKLAAQIIWFILDGFASKKNDQPSVKNKEDFMSFYVNIDGVDDEVEFVKNKYSLRWWIKVPSQYAPVKTEYFASCSNSDYQKACNNEIPEILLNFVKRKF